MNFKAATALALVPALLVLTGCPRPKDDQPQKPDQQQKQQASQEALTLSEARSALEEVKASGEASSLIAGSIEVTTGFTIGQAVEQAAQEIGEFVASQLPCAEIAVESHSLTIEYGAKPGDCTYNGHTFSGTHSISVEANEDYDVLVHHEWDELSNGNVSATGFADVTWSLQDRTRQVVHELEWTRLSDGRTGSGSGDRLQSALNGNLAEGFAVDGYRAWQGQAGQWDLDINEIEWRWSDPVPQSGSYVLETPKGKTLSLSFAREDEDSIRVTVSGTRRSFDILVHKPGGADDAEDAQADAS